MSARWLLSVELPLRIDSRTAGNSREHWAAKAKRVKAHRGAMALALRAQPRAWLDAAQKALSAPRPRVVRVAFVRVAPRELDSHDNLRMGLKPLADAVAEWLGLDDADERLRWEYRQERAAPRQGINRQLPHLGNAGQGINRQLPHLGNAGQGIREEMARLGARLRRVRVACGDWERVLGDSVTWRHGMTGVLLDPPYTKGAMQYSVGRAPAGSVASAVAAWARRAGQRPDMRIALCGHAGEHDMPGWREVPWTARGGYGNQGGDDDDDNRHREVVWFSPACIGVAQGVLL